MYPYGALHDISFSNRSVSHTQFIAHVLFQIVIYFIFWKFGKIRVVDSVSVRPLTHILSLTLPGVTCGNEISPPEHLLLVDCHLTPFLQQLSNSHPWS